MSVPALPHLRPRLVGIVAMLLRYIPAAALAQSAPEIPPPDPTQSVAAAVVSIGVVALEPNAESSTLDSLANHPVSIRGSGFFVDKKGHVITALHVVRAAERARDEMKGTDNRLIVGLRSAGGFVAVPAELIGTDEAHDLALLRTNLPGSVRNFVKLSSARPDDGALIEAAGLPANTGMALVANTGHLADTVLLQPGNFIANSRADSDVAQQSRLREFYLADLNADEGMSGGPVYLLESGAVIGVVHGYTHDPRFAVLVPARYVVELLKSNNVGYAESVTGKSQ
jgi:S1-C subfamily serine protease